MTTYNRSPALVGLMLGLAACGDEPTAARRPTLTVSAEQLAAIQSVLDDARTRLVPALLDQVMAAEMQDQLAVLTVSLAARDRERFGRALGSARVALGRYESGFGPRDTQMADAGDVVWPDAPIVETLRFQIGRIAAVALGESPEE